MGNTTLLRKIDEKMDKKMDGADLLKLDEQQALLLEAMSWQFQRELGSVDPEWAELFENSRRLQNIVEKDQVLSAADQQRRPGILYGATTEEPHR